MVINAGRRQINIDFNFVNKIQEEFYYCNKRNQCFSGGYGNGKSFGASMKALTLLTTFPYYRIGLSRYSAKELTQSTMQTFFKICPQELYNDAYGGRRNDRDGELRLINNSEIYWMHLDDYAEEDLRGKEFNSVITDQAEEIAENIYITLDSRIERWDRVEIPPHLNPEHFPINPFTKKPMPPCYNIILVNPDITLHWVYKRFHPDSPDRFRYCGQEERLDTFGEHSIAQYYTTAAYFSASTHDNPAIPETLKQAMRSRDPGWVDRFYWGKWGIAGGSIHYVHSESIIEFKDAEKLLDIIRKDGIKFRVMDHGEAAPTCCLWFAWLPPSVLRRNYNNLDSKGVHICYREYYAPGKLISDHRNAIADLSGDERYYGNFADPAIFKKTSQKYGGFWSVAEEYADKRITAPPIYWNPADNEELSTRNAIAELLLKDPLVRHPITGESPAPSIYFIKRCHEYPNGCNQVIHQTQAARHKKIGSENGEDIYCDDRAPDVADHAYDPLRYYSILPKITHLPEKPRELPQFSIGRYMEKARRLRRRGFYGR